jgi:hypothetical protein
VSFVLYFPSPWGRICFGGFLWLIHLFIKREGHCERSSGCRGLPERLYLYSRDGWPLLTVETEVNGDSKSSNDRCPSLVSLISSLGLSCKYERFLFCLGCPSRPCTKYLFPNAQQAGQWQVAVPGRLSLSLCLCRLHV